MRNRNTALALALLCAVACHTNGPEKNATGREVARATSEAATTATRTERLEAITKEFDLAMNAYKELFDKAKSDKEVQTIAKTAQRPHAEGFGKRVQVLIDEDPTDDTAFSALAWMLANPAARANQDAVFDTLEKYHLQNTRLLEVVQSLRGNRLPRARQLLERALNESPHEDVRAMACYVLAQAEIVDVRSVRTLATLLDGERLSSWKQFLGESELARLKGLDPAVAEAAAEARLERVMKEFGQGSRRWLGESAECDLFELKNLAIGKVAPDIEGEDVSGVPFKLSDYRGKVVVLDFWGNW